jgi:glycosyltransferase involved in cell wall biosynthesis
MIKLAYFVSHPIQYQAPLLRRIAQEPDIAFEVFFGSDFSLHEHEEESFGRTVQWDVDLLGGYKHEFLPQIWKARENGVFSPANYGVGHRLRKGKFDALWVHGYLRPTNLLAMAEAFRAGVRVLVRDDVTLQGSQTIARLAGLKRAVAYWQVRHGSMYLATGSTNAAYYRALAVPEDRIVIMPYAVDNLRFQQQADAAAEQVHRLRSELNLEPQRPVILFVGKFIPLKQIDVLIRAYSKLPLKNGEPWPYLVLVGDGPVRAELEQLAVQCGLPGVRFAGFQNQTELPAFFCLGTVLVLPSNLERWGLVVNEAMNCGCAAIVSHIVGCGPDLVENGVTGYRFTAGDVDGLSDALHKVTCDPEHARAMGEASFRRIGSWDYEADVRALREALARLFPDRINVAARAIPA